MSKDGVTRWSWTLTPKILKWTIVLVLTVLVVAYLLLSHRHAVAVV